MGRRLIFSVVTAAVFAFNMRVIAEEKKIDPCALVTKAEVESVMGTLKEAPKPGEGVRPGEVTCEFTNEKGSWTKIRVYSLTLESWEFQKNMMDQTKVTKLPGLGDEAFWEKKSSSAEVYIRKGGTILEVDSSGSIDFAKPIAEKALGRLK